MATLQVSYNTGDNNQEGNQDSSIWLATTFTTGTDGFSATSVKLLLRRTGAGAPGAFGNIEVAIRATSGGTPTGADLAEGTTPGGTLPAFPAASEWREITFVTPVTLLPNTKYAIVVNTPGAVSFPPDYPFWKMAIPGLYANGDGYLSYDSGVTWDDPLTTWGDNADFMFEVWGGAPPEVTTYSLEVLMDSSLSADLKATLVKRILKTLERSGRSLSLSGGSYSAGSTSVNNQSITVT